jgi:hypothetical protein
MPDEPLDTATTLLEQPNLTAHTVASSDTPHGVAPADENVFRTLARQARSRSATQLWIITLGGAVDGIILGWTHPGLSWLATGCAATAAYGIWGLLDRAVPVDAPNAATSAAIDVRNVVAVLGTGAAVWTVLSFMATVLGNWNH